MTKYRGIEVGDDEATEGKKDGVDSIRCPNGLEHQNCNDNDCQCSCHTGQSDASRDHRRYDW